MQGFIRLIFVSGSSSRKWERHFTACTIKAYFKESLRLQRTDKFQTSKHLQISCQNKVSFPKNFRRPFFLFLVITTKISRYFILFYFSISCTKNSDDLF